jgi:hypothetical protein
VIYSLYIEIKQLKILAAIIHQVSQKAIEDSVFSAVGLAWSWSHAGQVNGDD